MGWAAAVIAVCVAARAGANPPLPPTPPQGAVLTDLAPADEYFGRQKISVIAIRHQIFSLKDDLHHGRKRPDYIEHGADTLDEAFTDWARRFPRDAWLPRTGWELATLYEELPGGDARARAVSLLGFVKSHYGGSVFAQDSAKDLARGVGVRAWPKWAGRPPSTPAPPATATSIPTPARTAPTQTATPAQTAAPSPTGSPVAQPSGIVDPSSLFDATQRLEVRARDPRENGDALLGQALGVEHLFTALSRNGSDPRYDRDAWELAVLYELLPGEDARAHAIRALALVLDRYPDTEYAQRALRDLERGIGVRP